MPIDIEHWVLITRDDTARSVRALKLGDEPKQNILAINNTPAKQTLRMGQGRFPQYRKCRLTSCSHPAERTGGWGSDTR